jgi:hypothetical protein
VGAGVGELAVDCGALGLGAELVGGFGVDDDDGSRCRVDSFATPQV